MRTSVRLGSLSQMLLFQNGGQTLLGKIHGSRGEGVITVVAGG